LVFFFKQSINDIVRLIMEQIKRAEVHERRITVCIITSCPFNTHDEQNIFMIGGFGMSEYLQAELRKAMKKNDVNIYQPDNS
jgi:tRNA A37 threonylcarbamoyltransferase TsaD